MLPDSMTRDTYQMLIVASEHHDCADRLAFGARQPASRPVRLQVLFEKGGMDGVLCKRLERLGYLLISTTRRAH